MAMTSNDLWRECAAWLTRCQVIPVDHKANYPNSQIEVLARTLRDGVLLCNLLNYLDASSLDVRDFNRKPQMAQFLCCQNISHFLTTCKTVYGLRDSDLFDPMMLYNLGDFQKVLITLSKLSRCARVAQLHPNLSGFTVPLSNERSEEEEDIYKDLQSTTTEIGASHDHADEDQSVTKEEALYQELCAIRRDSRSQLAADDHRVTASKRDYVIRELVDTETNYLSVLKALRDIFMAPMATVVTEDILRTIFPRIKDLVEIHDGFLDKLRDATSASPSMKLSQVLLESRKPFLMYGEYCSCITNAVDTLRGLTRKKPEFEQLVHQCQKLYNGNRSALHDILTVPMQRVLKYPLLLNSLVAETPPTHDDFRGLERAKEAMIDVADYINEVKRDSEHLDIIQKVKDRILDLNLPGGNDLKQYGRLILDGELSLKSHEDNRVKTRYAFIFTKLLILVKKTVDSNYSFRDSHNLSDYQVEQCTSRRTLGRDARFRFQMLLARKSKTAAFTLYMKSEGERETWTKKLQEAMEIIEPPGVRSTDHKFVVANFEEPTMCLHCSKFLKGLIHQGYKCTVCSIPVHRSCILSTGRCRQTTVFPTEALLPPPVCERQLSEFYWFVGEMDRDTASTRLESRKIGTYLLRVRPHGASNAMETMYALSLKTAEGVIKHMKINQKREGTAVLFYLSSRRHFKTIVELVSFYERNDLGENFAGLNQLLQWPFRGVMATALYEFSPTEPNQLPLRQGCLVLVIGKEGDSKGWWRGKAMERVGFFPKDYVREHPQAMDEL